MRETSVHNGGSRFERSRVTEGRPQEQHRIDTAAHRCCRGNASRALLYDTQESQPRHFAQAVALRARQFGLALQRMRGNRTLETA